MELFEQLKLLCGEDGVSGDEKRVAERAAELLRPLCDSVEIDSFCNVIAKRASSNPDAPTLLLDAHIDQIGFLITEITSGGFLRFLSVGGVDPRMLPGSEVTVLTREHGALRGVIGAVPPHLQNGDQTKAPAIDTMTIDLGMTYDQAKAAVRVGDYAVFKSKPLDLQNGQLCSRALDDRACLICIIHALTLLADKPLPLNIVVSASTKEELGGHGSQFICEKIKPDYAIAVDVTHAKTPDSPDTVGRLGKGASVSIGSNSRPELAEKIIASAKRHGIPFQTSACCGHSGTNAWSMQPVAEGVGTLVLSLPLKYMHSPVEVLDREDVLNTGALIAAFVSDFDGRVSL